jgi:hypothetical protein
VMKKANVETKARNSSHFNSLSAQLTLVLRCGTFAPIHNGN